MKAYLQAELFRRGSLLSERRRMSRFGSRIWHLLARDAVWSEAYCQVLATIRRTWMDQPASLSGDSSRRRPVVHEQTLFADYRGKFRCGVRPDERRTYLRYLVHDRARWLWHFLVDPTLSYRSSRRSSLVFATSNSFQFTLPAAATRGLIERVA